MVVVREEGERAGRWKRYGLRQTLATLYAPAPRVDPADVSTHIARVWQSTAPAFSSTVAT